MYYKSIGICLGLLLIASLIFIGATNGAYDDVSHDTDITTVDQRNYSYNIGNIDLCSTSILGQSSSYCVSNCKYCYYDPIYDVSNYRYCVAVIE